MTTTITRQRLTIAHLQRELEKEKKRYANLRMPRLKADSGVRVAMLRDRVNSNQDKLRELLVIKGYLRGTSERQS